MYWFNSSILPWMFFSLLLNVLIACLWEKKIYIKFGLKSYSAIQRIHLNEVPRLGGFVFIISLIGFSIFGNLAADCKDILYLILLTIFPTTLVGLKEDLFHNVRPLVRLVFLVISGWLFCKHYLGPFPNMKDVPLISSFFHHSYSVYIFYIFGIVSISNAMNLLDGVNGLCSLITLAIMSSLLFLSYKTNDVLMLNLIFSLILLVIPFTLINYPLGKIFLGDLGAYTFGIIVSILTIILYGRHPELPVWGAVLILIYPLTEVCFSIFRRSLKNTPIHKPDKLHLHLNIFLFLQSSSAFKKFANSLVLPILSFLWLFPLVTIYWFYNKIFFILISILFFIFLYLLIYKLSLILLSKKRPNH